MNLLTHLKVIATLLTFAFVLFLMAEFRDIALYILLGIAAVMLYFGIYLCLDKDKS